jgi:hypothetical protein
MSLTKKGFRKMRNPLLFLAGTTRLELATSGVTGRRSNRLNYIPLKNVLSLAHRFGIYTTTACK